MFRIFEAFRHLDKSGTESHEESTGLGLTLVERIVGAHGGRVQVQSEEGKGALFTVILPLDIKQNKINESMGRNL